MNNIEILLFGIFVELAIITGVCLWWRFVG